MLFIYNYIKFFITKRIFGKIIWASNHFLTMEFYRKLCNRLYWKKLEPGSIPYTTRCWLIFLSAISVIWLAFFFDPMDPNYSKSPSNIISNISKYVKKFEYTLFNLFTFSCFRSVDSLKLLSINNSNNILSGTNHKTYIKISSFLI